MTSSNVQLVTEAERLFAAIHAELVVARQWDAARYVRLDAIEVKLIARLERRCAKAVPA